MSDQGGGCPVPGLEQLWPEIANISAGPLGADGDLSHLARFSEIVLERQYLPNDTISGGPQGQPMPIDWGSPAVLSFSPNPQVSDFEDFPEAHALASYFAGNYTQLLVALHKVFNGQPDTYFSTITAMHQITGLATALLETPDPRNSSQVLGLTWEYVPEASEYEAREGKPRPGFDVQP